MMRIMSTIISILVAMPLERGIAQAANLTPQVSKVAAGERTDESKIVDIRYGLVDADGDGVDDAVDVCQNTPPGIAVDVLGRPLGDIDQDCDTDLHDFELFRQGFTGPIVPPGMVPIPAGTFHMGDHHDGMYWALPMHDVTLSAFFMDQYKVTKGLWDTVRTWSVSNGYDLIVAPGNAPDHPVHSVNWYDCVKWANARSQREGRTPCYYTDPGLTTVYKTGEVAPYVKWGACAYRLPIEAEWEYAARGGLHNPYRRYPWGDTVDCTNANYDNCVGDTTVVGSYPFNNYHLYDMAGNVWEWCQDVWHDNYDGAPVDGSAWTTGGYPEFRVVRGGSWGDHDGFLRCANRIHRGPGGRDIYGGFRLTLDSE